MHQEVAYLGYYLHWSHVEIMAFTHAERAQWVREVASINRLLSDREDQPGHVE